jgi:16S rRNA (cytidine1402-2'-O)-methyltransferase
LRIERHVAVCQAPKKEQHRRSSHATPPISVQANSLQQYAIIQGVNFWTMARNQPPPSDVAENSSGILYLVGTPIGNLEDITLRALRTLKEVDLIACEDTRQTQKLLNHYGIEKRTVSYHEHNELERAPELIVHLENGDDVAIVSDAGMPGVSDPGYRLVALAVRHHIRVVPIPGASAFLSALVASGLPTDSFRFCGFLPAKAGARRSLLESSRTSPRTQIFYEAPHRLLETMKDVVDLLGPDRRVVIAREVTKLHEEFLRGRAADALADLEKRGEIKGEITLLIAKAEENAGATASSPSVAARVRELMQADGAEEKSALKQTAKEFGLSKSEAYREWQRAK